MKAAAVLLIAVLVAACAAEPSPPGGPSYFFPRYHPLNALPVAQVIGRLVADGPCLWIGDGVGRGLVLWEPESRLVLEGGQLVVTNGEDLAIVGTEVTGGGGEYGAEHLGFVRELIGGDIPIACRSERYLLTYSVRSVPD